MDAFDLSPQHPVAMVTHPLIPPRRKQISHLNMAGPFIINLLQIHWKLVVRDRDYLQLSDPTITIPYTISNIELQPFKVQHSLI